ncbi:Hypothetical protein, putative [Bodo saltans]|uniref:Uncharacterized protein n=1 Tax=Bodo saltans TaxID=75058 RepID=A0A0S4J830_BODSA|nr:Hypothetical protein, putative [Bodo saltans]|eukprot:CUG86235.1 Hypothetical protein, putative [Bodo saltans]
MTDDVATVSATFKEAMNTLTALREVEKSKKNDEFRARLAIADLTMSLDRVEQLWNNGILKRGGGEDKGPSPHQQQQHPFPVVAGTSGSSTDTQHHHDPNAVTTPSVLSPPVSNNNSTTAAGGVGGSANSSTSSKPSATLSHFAATVATLHERLEAIAEGMSSVLAAAAKGLPSPSLSIPQAASDEQVLVTITSASSAGDNGSFDKAGRGPLSNPQKQQQDNNSDAPFTVAPTSTTLSPSLRNRGPPVVTLLPAPEESFASPTTSGCFSPRGGQRSRGSISISDSVSFIPEELFRPDASDMVSRGTMTKVVLTASTAVQSSSKGSSAEEAQQLLRYVQLLETYCTKEQLEEAKKSTMSL